MPNSDSNFDNIQVDFRLWDMGESNYRRIDGLSIELPHGHDDPNNAKIRIYDAKHTGWIDAWAG